MKVHMSRLVAVLVAALVVAGCTNSSAQPDGAESTSPAPSPSSTPEPSATPSASETGDPLAAPPPDEVDLAYVQRVLEAIYAVEDLVLLDEIGHALNGGTQPTENMFQMLETAFSGQKLDFERRDVRNDFEGEGPTELYVEVPGPVVITATELVDSGPECIIVEFTYDGSARIEEQRPPSELLAQLEPKPDGVDPHVLNESPWVIMQQGTVEGVSGDPRCA